MFWMNEWIVSTKWTNERTNKRTNERPNEWTFVFIYTKINV